MQELAKSTVGMYIVYFADIGTVLLAQMVACAVSRLLNSMFGWTYTNIKLSLFLRRCQMLLLRFKDLATLYKLRKPHPFFVNVGSEKRIFKLKELPTACLHWCILPPQKEGIPVDQSLHVYISVFCPLSRRSPNGSPSSSPHQPRNRLRSTDNLNFRRVSSGVPPSIEGTESPFSDRFFRLETGAYVPTEVRQFHCPTIADFH